MKQALLLAAVFFAGVACSRLPDLTPDVLNQAEEKWKAHRPESYGVVIEMSGDRVETGRFEVTVRSGQIVSLRRNGLDIWPNAGQDNMRYSGKVRTKAIRNDRRIPHLLFVCWASAEEIVSNAVKMSFVLTFPSA